MFAGRVVVAVASVVAAGYLASSASADAAVQMRCGGWTHGHALASVRIRPGRVLRISVRDSAGYVLTQRLGPSIPLPRAKLVERRVFEFRFAGLGTYRFA